MSHSVDDCLAIDAGCNVGENGAKAMAGLFRENSAIKSVNFYGEQHSSLDLILAILIAPWFALQGPTSATKASKRWPTRSRATNRFWL